MNKYFETATKGNVDYLFRNRGSSCLNIEHDNRKVKCLNGQKECFKNTRYQGKLSGRY